MSKGQLARQVAGVLAELRDELRKYDDTCHEWAVVNIAADREGRAPDVGESEDYSESLEQHAHDLAELVRRLLNVGDDEVLSTTPEPLGGPVPGVNGFMPEAEPTDDEAPPVVGSHLPD